MALETFPICAVFQLGEIVDDYLTVLRFNFAICRMHVIIVPPQKGAVRTTGSNACRVICRVPGTSWAGIAVLL